MKRKRALRRWFYVGGMTPADSGGVEAGGRYRVQEVQHTRHSSDLDKFRSSFLPQKNACVSAERSFQKRGAKLTLFAVRVTPALGLGSKSVSLMSRTVLSNDARGSDSPRSRGQQL